MLIQLDFDDLEQLKKGQEIKVIFYSEYLIIDTQGQPLYERTLKGKFPEIVDPDALLEIEDLKEKLESST